MCLHVYIISIQSVPHATLPSETPAEVESVGLSDYRGERVYNLRIRGFSSQLPLTPPLSGFQLSGNETRCTGCQMSVHTDCRVTTWIRNSNRTPIKVVDRSKPRHRQHKESQEIQPAGASPFPEQTASPQTDWSTRPIGGDTSDLPTAKMMPICTVVEKRNGVVVGAELACTVREENKAQRESYSADWHSVSLKTQPQDR